MSPTSVTWRDLTVSSANGYTIESIEGWESLPSSRYDKSSRAQGHGAHSSPVWSDERLVTVTGTSHSIDARDQLLLDLQKSMAFGDGEEPLTITLAGRTLTTGAQLLRCDPVVETGSWNIGLIKWVAQWRCPDPLRYSPPRTVSAGLPTSGGGLAYPMTYPLDHGALGATGQLTLSNAGTAPAPILFNVRGGLPLGWELSAVGERLTYPVAVPAGQVIDIDTAAGTVLVEGTASRRANLTSADWLTVPARGSLTVQFTSLGGAYDPAAQAVATVQDTYW